MKSLKLVALVIISSVAFASCTSPASSPQGSNIESPRVSLASPIEGSKIVSPVNIIGVAPGTWFSEGQIPVELLAHDGSSIAVVVAMAEGEWMTEKEVPFRATMTFTTTEEEGTLVIRKDNPSGLPENDASFSPAVTF